MFCHGAQNIVKIVRTKKTGQLDRKKAWCCITVLTIEATENDTASASDSAYRAARINSDMWFPIAGGKVVHGRKLPNQPTD